MRSCYICGRTDWVERHHIYGGSRRKQSEKYGLVIDLCHDHHNGSRESVHHNKDMRLFVQRLGQVWFEKEHTREEFMSIFGRNYL